MRNSRRATIASVAVAAGVSTATVSRVLNDANSVSERTRERVELAIEQLDYRPSDLTRAVFAGRSNAIGVLFADMRSPYYVGLIEGISHVANKEGTLAYLAAGNREAEQEQRILSLLDSHRVRGLITASHGNDEIIERMANAGTESVYITRVPNFTHPRTHSIQLDNLAAGRLALTHLLEVGRSRFLIVNQTPLRLTSHHRTLGFIEAARDLGLDVNQIHTHELQSLDTPNPELAARLKKDVQESKIDAVFATTGVATFKAYEALSMAGLRAPDDLAFLGVDDFQWAEYLSSPLSVITQPTFDMGVGAAKIILDEPGESRHLVFPPSLIARHSSTGAQ